jgi:hypothetical protein
MGTEDPANAMRVWEGPLIRDVVHGNRYADIRVAIHYEEVQAR